jgi:hypothetical protein
MRAFIRTLAPLALLSTLFVPVGAATAEPALVDRFEVFVFEDYRCGGDEEEEPVLVEGEGTFQQVRKERFIHRTIRGEAVDGEDNEYVFHSTRISHESSGEFSFDQRIQLISKGSAPNQWFSVSERNGKITLKNECRG